METNYFDFIIDYTSGDGVIMVSEVESGAHGLDFCAFSDEVSNFNKNDEEMKMCGPIMRVDEWMWRKALNGYGKFSKEQIKLAHEHWMMTGKLLNGDVEHGNSNFGKEKPPTYWLEVWTVQDPNNDKANLFGFSADKLKSGDLFGIKKAEDTDSGKKYWEDYIKTGKIKSFSIQFDPKSFKIKENKMEEFAKDTTDVTVDEVKTTDSPVDTTVDTKEVIKDETKDVPVDAKPDETPYITKEEIDSIVKEKVTESIVDLSTRFDALESKLNDMMMEKQKLAEENSMLQATVEDFSNQVKDLKSNIPGSFNSNKPEIKIEEMSAYQRFKQENKMWRKN